jgi:arylsulfatase A-like enzyme
LAAGAPFTQFHVRAPVCGPIRTGFMTGNSPARHRIHDSFSSPAIEDNGPDSFRFSTPPNWPSPKVAALPSLYRLEY